MAPPARPFTGSIPDPPLPTGSDPYVWSEEPNPPLLMEALARHSELKNVGTARFTGSASHKNYLWRHYRNYIRQAMSNFQVAMNVPNRSSSLLYYYSLLNFAKAELLNQNYGAIADQGIHHGLTFSPAKARTVAGDFLTVRRGIFPLLYRHRTGRSIPLGTKLSVKRLLCAIPEIGSQIIAAGFGTPATKTLDRIVAWDATECWDLLRVDVTFLSTPSSTRSYILKHFREVEAPPFWQNSFGLSRRFHRQGGFLESKRVITHGGQVRLSDVRPIMDDISDVVWLSSSGGSDAFITPYLNNTRQIVMPPSLARYAVAFYGSSLVRYRPTAFDADRFPEQAYLFDAVARECAVPMLVDTLTQLEGQPQLFFPENSWRA